MSEWNRNSRLKDEGTSYPGKETRQRQNQKLFRQYGSKRPVKRPNLTQDEVLVLKQAWAQEQPQGALYRIYGTI